MKQGPAGQQCVHGHSKLIKHILKLILHIKHTQHTKQIQRWQCLTVPMIFMKKTAPFRRLKKKTGKDGRCTLVILCQRPFSVYTHYF